MQINNNFTFVIYFKANNPKNQQNTYIYFVLYLVLPGYIRINYLTNYIKNLIIYLVI